MYWYGYQCADGCFERWSERMANTKNKKRAKSKETTENESNRRASREEQARDTIEASDVTFSRRWSLESSTLPSQRTFLPLPALQYHGLPCYHRPHRPVLLLMKRYSCFGQRVQKRLGLWYSIFVCISLWQNWLIGPIQVTCTLVCMHKLKKWT